MATTTATTHTHLPLFHPPPSPSSRELLPFSAQPRHRHELRIGACPDMRVSTTALFSILSLSSQRVCEWTWIWGGTGSVWWHLGFHVCVCVCVWYALPSLPPSPAISLARTPSSHVRTCTCPSRQVVCEREGERDMYERSSVGVGVRVFYLSLCPPTLLLVCFLLLRHRYWVDWFAGIIAPPPTHTPLSPRKPLLCVYVVLPRHLSSSYFRLLLRAFDSLSSRVYACVCVPVRARGCVCVWLSW